MTQLRHCLFVVISFWDCYFAGDFNADPGWVDETDGSWEPRAILNRYLAKGVMYLVTYTSLWGSKCLFSGPPDTFRSESPWFIFMHRLCPARLLCVRWHTTQCLRSFPSGTVVAKSSRFSLIPPIIVVFLIGNVVLILTSIPAFYRLLGPIISPLELWLHVFGISSRGHSIYMYADGFLQSELSTSWIQNVSPCSGIFLGL